MGFIYQALWTAISVASLSFIVTKGLIAVNKKWHIHDKDTHQIKSTSGTVPTLGGIAVYVSFWAGMLLLFPNALLYGSWKYTFLASTLVVVTGLLDDFIELKPWQKSIGIVLAASIVFFLTEIQFSANLILNIKPEWFKALSFVLTIAWIYFVTNAVNLLDGLDGLSSSVSLVGILSAATTMMLFHVTIPMTGLVSFVLLAAAIIGFLPNNWYPAKIYLGDTGALFIGFMYATFTVSGLKNAGFYSLLIPVFFYMIPIFDTTYAMLRRILTGKSPVRADREHLHHRLLRMGFKEYQVVLMMIVITIIFATVGLLIEGFYRYRIWIIMGGIVLIAVLFLIMQFIAKKGKRQSTK